MAEVSYGVIDKKPEWVPGWAWGFYVKNGHLMRGASRLIEAKEARSVWAALERRTRVGPLERRAMALFHGVHWALDFSGDVTLGSGERLRRAQPVRKAATMLAEALRANAGILDSHARLFADSMAAQVLGVDKPSEDDEEVFSRGAWLAARETAFNLPALLDALSKDAEAWASEAIVLRPNKHNAARTYFVRYMTRTFVSDYRTPMRAPTLAITSLYFDCENMTPADIASIAPMPLEGSEA